MPKSHRPLVAAVHLDGRHLVVNSVPDELPVRGSTGAAVFLIRPQDDPEGCGAAAVRAAG